MQISNKQQQTKDSYALSQSTRAIKNLWEVLGGDLSKLPDDYCEQFAYEFSDGDISLISHLAKVDDISRMGADEFAELVDYFSKVNPKDWPEPSAIQEIILSRLGEEEEVDFTEEELDFGEVNYGPKVEALLKKVISTVYRDGVARVLDTTGRPPSPENEYLRSDDGGSFQGVFITSQGEGGKRSKYPFTIRERDGGQWEITY
jgi:hypothetical protein